MRKFTLFLAFLFFVGMQVVQAQDKALTGTVTSSEDGQPIPGVQVVVKGTTMGTITDLDGNFTIAVPSDATVLVFTYIGMASQEIAIGSEANFTVTLEPDILNLEGVVVTALGITREKKSLGYAVQEVSGDELTQVRETNVVNSISGKVSGVHIRQSGTMGGSANVLIRGTTSLTQNNQALFVVDGVPLDNNNTNEDRYVANSTASNQNDGWGGYDYGNAAMDINPDDIESMSVLKGAAATALYGSRAANGVILITTKKGRKGKGGGIGISINSGVTMSMIDKSTLPKYQDQYGGGYGAFYDDPTGYFFYGDVDGDGQDDLIAPTTEDASWGAKFDPNLMVVHWDALDPEASNYGEKRPWVAGANDIGYFFKTGLKWTNSVAFDGANDMGRFRVSYTNVDEEGTLANSSIKKNTVNFAGNYNFTDRLSVDANMTYVNTKGLGRYGTGYDGMNPMQQLGQWFQRNVDLKRLEEKYLRADGTQLSWNHSYWTSDDGSHLKPIYADNPYWTRNKNFENDERNRVFGYAAANYKFTDYLTLTGRMSIDTYNEIQNERIAVSSVDPSYFSNFTRNFFEVNYDLMLKFNKTFGDFSVNGLVGSNSRKTVINSILGQTVGGLVVPDLYSVSNSISPARVTETLKEKRVNSLFGSASIGYQNFIYLDITARNDWSSTLPTDKNSYIYPGVSLSFVLTELEGMQDINWLSYAKVRGNYAEVGNDAPIYSTTSTYSQNTTWDGNALFSVNSTLQNPELKPEKTKSWEFGAEASFLHRRLSFDIATYKANTFDQILPVLVSPTSGYTRMWVNGGEIENSGWEISMSGTPIKTQSGLTWDLGLNWFSNKNKVISLYGDVDNLLIYSAWDVSINATVGEAYGAIRGTDFVYTDGKKTVDENGYYLMTATDEVIGNINPDWNMGVTSNLHYKGIGLYILVDIQKGGDVYSVNTKYGEATGLYAETAELNDKGVQMRDPVEEGGGYLFPETVYEDGTPNTTYVPAYRWGRAFYYNNSPTARYVFDASYVKLREVALSYSLPSAIVEKTPFYNVTFSLVGRNLWIIHKNTEHFDPESGLGSGNNQGIETGSYPTTRTFGFNLKLGI